MAHLKTECVRETHPRVADPHKALLRDYFFCRVDTDPSTDTGILIEFSCKKWSHGDLEI
jgi:hypothetical protein